MAIHLDDHRDTLDELGEHAAEVLRSVWQDAVRVFSPRGLETWLAAAQGLKSLGRGTDLVASFIESSPAVARELGEAAVSEMHTAALRMYSKTSASVLALLFSTAPTAAARLGEIELFRSWLTLLEQLLAQAPRALRPLLEHLNLLLAQLTLGGLRRWALWGVAAHRTDYEAQAAYFALDSPESQAVLQKERRGTLFVDVQRRLNIYLRALWGRDFWLRPTSGDFETREGYRAYIEGWFVHLPDAYDDIAFADGSTLPGLEVYRAAAAHCAAHIVHSRPFADAESLPALERALIGLLEDARIEALAARAFPGLGPLWRLLLGADLAGEGTAALLDRIARALADADWADPHPLVAQARAAFAALPGPQAEGGAGAVQAAVRAAGVALAQAALEQGLAFHPRSDAPTAPHRDDNRWLWQPPQDDFERIALDLPAGERRRYVSVMEMINAVDVEFAGDDAQEIWVLASELYDDDGTSFNAREGREPVAPPRQYPEWDYQTQLERPLWCTVLDKRPPAGDAALIDALTEKHKPLVARIKRLIESMQPQGVVRVRRQEDGDEIDLNAAIQAMLDLRLGQQPDPRIGIRVRRHERDLAVLLLIDLSESTNDAVRGAAEGTTVLGLAREATALLADALQRIGDPFAIHGFASNGRHDVEYFRFKDFDAEYDQIARARLAGMRGQLSTRMGAALRHAGHLLARRPNRKKLLLVLTDGEPADNDVRDPQYLRHDARKAVEELARQGISSYCLSLDPQADQYVARIFGERHFMVLDNVQRLPEKLSTLYLGLTR